MIITDSSHIHIALIGDLLYGRTIHSKVEGLRIYDSVHVDLIAPEVLALPDSYLNKMYEYGYQVRIFSSVDDYLKQSQHAPIRYWTRVQIERMGEDIIKQEYKIRQAITCRPDHWLSNLDYDGSISIFCFLDTSSILVISNDIMLFEIAWIIR
jgi:aspartate carbamoyltransferase